MNHFTPKIDSWAALNHLTSLSSEQVCKHDLSSSLHVQLFVFNEEKTVVSVLAARPGRAFFISTFLFDGRDNARNQ